MIHAQQRRETAAGTPVASAPRDPAPRDPAPRDSGSPDVATSDVVVPAQQKRRPDAYDLYAEIFALRAESRPV